MMKFRLSIAYELFTCGRKMKDFIMDLIEKLIKLFVVSLERFTVEFNSSFLEGWGCRKAVHRRSGESMKPQNGCNQTQVQIPGHYLPDV